MGVVFLKHLFIINPVAGGKNGRPEETERSIRSITGELEDPYEIFITKAPMEAADKVSAEAETADMLRVYACGGDGTLNECVNGAAMRTNVAITNYPCGTGNDFIRMFGQDDMQKFRDLKALVNGTVRPLDLIECGGRYGINICSVGIDARVGRDVHKYSKIPIIGGATGYVVSLAANVIKGVKQDLRISTDDLTLERKITLACACNGRFYGGGFNPVPEAIPDDGILECIIIDGVSRMKVAQIVGKYAKGRFREIKGVVTYVRGTYMEIESEREFAVNIDGEIISAKKICFKIIPKAINFLFPVGFRYFNNAL